MNQVCFYLIFCCISFSEVCCIFVEHRDIAVLPVLSHPRPCALPHYYWPGSRQEEGELYFCTLKTDPGSVLRFEGMRVLELLYRALCSKPGNYSHRLVFSALLIGENAVSLVFFWRKSLGWNDKQLKWANYNFSYLTNGQIWLG